MKSLFSSAIFFCYTAAALAQNVGINTTSPQRPLDIRGDVPLYLRIQSTTGVEAGLELVNGNTGVSAVDWKMVNNIGTFGLLLGDDNFSTSGYTAFRINSNGDVGLNSVISDARLHVNNGSEASAFEHGFMVVGSGTGLNIVMDQNEINARSNNNPSTLFLQENGGHTFFGENGGNTYIGLGDGNLGIGTSATDAKVTVESTDFQINFRNSAAGSNDWHMGASNDSWSIGDHQLVFSPGNASSSSRFRLMHTGGNNGINAPVMIPSSAAQLLLLDGNEIDSRFGPLYFNHNSNQNTLVNPSGGNVGVGLTDPTATLHINTPPNDYAIRIERYGVQWGIHPYPVVDRLGFSKNGVDLAHVNGANGQWIALSDARKKTGITPLPALMDKVNAIGLYTYHFKADPQKKRQYGVIAQELIHLFPEAVQTHGENHHVAYAQLAVIALKALQEQQAEIDLLQAELQLLLQN